MEETPPCRAAPLFFHSASGVSGMGGLLDALAYACLGTALTLATVAGVIVAFNGHAVFGAVAAIGFGALTIVLWRAA